jgi:2-polyprenyl-3-methyl-5-hydroxy-6-metoxy-1,4-benzoquinol methylase
MIICPICDTELKISKTEYTCISCKSSFKIEEGIIIYHTEIIDDNEDYNSENLDLLFSFENKHFWFLYRKQIILKVFQKFIKKHERIIEIGAGTGNVSQMVLTNGYKNIANGEMHMSGLLHAKKYGLTELFQFNLLQAPFSEHFDVVGMFDVLEHIESDELALNNVNKMLSPDGRLILTVPSHMWLWSNIDMNSGHKRRYNYSGLKTLLEKSNFEVIYYRSFFIIMLPILFFRALINKKHIKLNTENLARNAGMTINPVTNALLKFICKLENFLLKGISLKFGGSLLVVARKI